MTQEFGRVAGDGSTPQGRNSKDEGQIFFAATTGPTAEKRTGRSYKANAGTGRGSVEHGEPDSTFFRFTLIKSSYDVKKKNVKLSLAVVFRSPPDSFVGCC